MTDTDQGEEHNRAEEQGEARGSESRGEKEGAAAESAPQQATDENTNGNAGPKDSGKAGSKAASKATSKAGSKAASQKGSRRQSAAVSKRTSRAGSARSKQQQAGSGEGIQEEKEGEGEAGEAKQQQKQEGAESEPAQDGEQHGGEEEGGGEQRGAKDSDAQAGDDATSTASVEATATAAAAAAAPTADAKPTVAALYKDGLPENVLAMFLTGATQELFGCVVDEAVTAEKPTFLIPIEKIKEDFINRAAVSDFSVCKEQIQNYDGDELLIVYDPDFTFDTNFIACLTEAAKSDFHRRVEAQEAAAKEAARQAKDASGEEGFDDEDAMPLLMKKKKRREPAPWQSLGSEVEVDNMKSAPSRPPICLLVSRKRRLFGAPYRFADAQFPEEHEYPPATEFKSQTPHEDAPAPVHRRLMHVAAQAIPDNTTSTTQTTWFPLRNASTQWEARTMTEAKATGTSTVPTTEEDHAELAQAMQTAYNRLRPVLLQNAVLNVHVDDFLRLRGEKHVALGTKADSALKEFQSFKYMNFESTRTVSCVDWHPTEPGVVAIAYSKPVTLAERIATEKPNDKSRVLLWGLSDPIQPKLILEAPDDVLSVQFCPTHPNYILVGCFNGQLALFDLGKQGRRLKASSSRPQGTQAGQEVTMRHVALSDIDDGHRAPVSQVQWLPAVCDVSASGAMTAAEEAPQYTYQAMSCAADGTCLIWDIRGEEKENGVDAKTLDLAWKPLVKVYLSSDAGGEVMANRFTFLRTHRDIKAERAPDVEMTTDLCVGSEQGHLHFLDWKRPESDTGKLGVQQIRATVQAHGGPCAAVVRSPFFPSLLLSVGGNSLSLWHDKAFKPLLQYRLPAISRPVAGCWSLHRAGVFFVAREDGNVDVWDFLDTSYKPSLTQSVCAPTPLTTLAACDTCIPSAHGRHFFLAAGDANGSTHIIDLPKTLIHPVANEHQFVASFLEREVTRLTGGSHSLPEVELAGLLSGQAEGEPGEGGADSEVAGGISIVVPGGDASAGAGAAAAAVGGGVGTEGAASPEDLKAIYGEFKKAERDFLVQVGLRSENEDEEAEAR